MYVYVCVHIGIETYLQENHLFLTVSIKRRCQIKVDERLKNIIITALPNKTHFGRMATSLQKIKKGTSDYYLDCRLASQASLIL